MENRMRSRARARKPINVRGDDEVPAINTVYICFSKLPE